MHWMDLVLAVAGTFLLGFEGYAIANSVPGDTISERVRVYFRIKRGAGRGGAFIFLAFVGSFVAWFAAHIVGNAGVTV